MTLHGKHRLRVLLFLCGAVLLLLALNTAFRFLNTLDRLNVVEAERDQWQRPSDVIRALDLHTGSVVVDLGSGAGYFTLKLAPLAGRRGKVVAVDLRKLSLLFLRVRAFLRNEHNIEVVVGDENDPHLAPGAADSMLICNTYHEFRDRLSMVDYTFKALRPGGRLVVVDRSPRPLGAENDHEIPAASVESDLRKSGFEILAREESFIDRPGDDPWWLIVARKPKNS